MKRFSTTAIAVVAAIMFNPIGVYASQSLDDVINANQHDSVIVNEQTVDEQQIVNESDTAIQTESGTIIDYGIAGIKNEDLIDSLGEATELDGPSNAANKVNALIKKGASFIINILSYGITLLLVVRVLLDLCYVVIPFSRSILSNGYAGNPNAGAQMPQNNGYNMGGYSRYGYSGFGNQSYANQYTNNQLSSGASVNNTREAMSGTIQLVSTSALNAVSAESVQGQGGKAINALKVYAKDMIVVLVITPVLLVLAISGALMNVGFMLGGVIANALVNVGSWM